MAKQTLLIHPADNIEVALSNLDIGTIIQNGKANLTLKEFIPAKHKFAIADIPEGGEIRMYGVLVGMAMKPIAQGELISTNNIRHASEGYKLGKRKTDWHRPDITKWKDKTFMGFHRPDGSVGTANYWLVIPLVFCENKNVTVLEEAFMKALGYKPKQSTYQEFVEKLISLKYASKGAEDILHAELNEINNDGKSFQVFPNIDGIKFLNHTLGCGGTRQDAKSLCGLLAGYITHPNTAGATVLSLGCQNAQVSILMEEIKVRNPHYDRPLYILEQQKVGNEQKMLEQAIKKTFTGMMLANENVRKPASLNKLCIGLECGGSDGFSGISANPAIGYSSDIVVALGGAVILSEFPELCGVEQELSDRCLDERTAGRFIGLMQDYNQKAESLGSGFYANPSPGNIRDGLITDAMKSAGAAKKGGTSPVTAVLDYPEKQTMPGLNLLCTPGSDVESTTAEVGSGANIILFTTGLGTPTGNPIAPVIKISSNTPLFEKMKDIIDIDTGDIIAGKETIQEAGERILEYVINVASGEIKAKSVEQLHDDFIPWKRGISL